MMAMIKLEMEKILSECSPPPPECRSRRIGDEKMKYTIFRMNMTDVIRKLRSIVTFFYSQHGKVFVHLIKAYNEAIEMEFQLVYTHCAM